MDRKKKQGIQRRRKAIRKKIIGSTDRPRMSVYKSNKNIYVQIVDDVQGRTICGLSTKSLNKEDKLKTRKNLNFAVVIGESIADKAIEKGIKKIVFDRSGYRYHGVVKALAEAARKKGLEF